MTILPDHKIAHQLSYGSLEVEPVNLEEQLQPASLDIRLGNNFKQFQKTEDSKIIQLDSDVADEMVDTKVPDDGKIVLWPGDFYLADTKESFKIPDYLLGRLTGRSSVARLGINVHQTAGLFDPGFEAESGVLEITNVSPRPVELQPGMRIAQMTFEQLQTQSSNPYNSEDNKYQNQQGAVESKIQEDR